MEQATPTSRMAGQLRPARQHMSPMITLRLQVDRLPLARTSLLAAPTKTPPWETGSEKVRNLVGLGLRKVDQDDRHGEPEIY